MLDIKSLLNNVPVEALKIIERKLTEDETLTDRTDQTVDVIMVLFLTTANIYRSKGKLVLKLEKSTTVTKHHNTESPLGPSKLQFEQTQFKKEKND